MSASHWYRGEQRCVTWHVFVWHSHTTFDSTSGLLAQLYPLFVMAALLIVPHKCNLSQIGTNGGAAFSCLQQRKCTTIFTILLFLSFLFSVFKVSQRTAARTPFLPFWSSLVAIWDFADNDRVFLFTLLQLLMLCLQRDFWHEELSFISIFSCVCSSMTHKFTHWQTHTLLDLIFGGNLRLYRPKIK